MNLADGSTGYGHLGFRSSGYSGFQGGEFQEAHRYRGVISRAWVCRYSAPKAWCQMLNVSLAELAPKDHVSPLDFAFLALMYNRVVFDCMPDEPLAFELGKLVRGVRTTIRASGHGSFVRMWSRFSGHRYEDNMTIDLCGRRHWLQVTALDNAIRQFKEGSDPLDPLTHVILDLWYHLNRMRNNRADLLRQQINRLWEWCTSAGGRTRTLPTLVWLEPSYLQYSTEVVEWAPDTTDWFRELRVLDVKQPWRNNWIDTPAEHPYNIPAISAPHFSCRLR
ncbi:hypothetical protein PHMEG_00025027 [Phytophthora megakarya]|uniref:Uncharacterized protein n=1 Tax=Phytophthora megakarya TaxID=4795 RepID=A0A225VDS3_9STRA|nr:hypothetical protein PHMEG_00025027 [Phytophthora megakarya]